MMIDDEFRAWQRDWQQLDASATMPRLDLSRQPTGWVAKLIGGIKAGLPQLGGRRRRFLKRKRPT
jgi:hypothetical protein